MYMLESIILFPGMIAHETAHALACLVAGVKVIEFKPWGLKEAHVKHEEPGPVGMVLVSLSPFFFNVFLAGLTIYFGHLSLKVGSFLLALFMYWLAFSFSYYAVPSTADVHNAYSSVTRSWWSWASGHEGMVKAVLAWIVTAPVFLPVLITLFILYLFARIDHIGVLVFVILFIWLASIFGI